jgi:hypothetical protein
MASSGLLRRVALAITDVSEELSASFIKVTRIGELGTTVHTSPIVVTLMKEALGSSETSVLTGATRRNISEDHILHSHRRENLKSYVFSTFSSAENGVSWDVTSCADSFHPEDGGDTFFRIVGSNKTHTVPQPKDGIVQVTTVKTSNPTSPLFRITEFLDFAHRPEFLIPDNSVKS